MVFAGGAFFAWSAFAWSAFASTTAWPLTTLTTTRRASATLRALTMPARGCTARAVVTFFKAGLAFPLWLALCGGIMRTFVGMNGGRVGLYFLALSFLALAEAQHFLQAGLQAAEHGGFFRGGIGAAGGGHKCVWKGKFAFIGQFDGQCKPADKLWAGAVRASGRNAPACPLPQNRSSGRDAGRWRSKPWFRSERSSCLLPA